MKRILPDIFEVSEPPTIGTGVESDVGEVMKTAFVADSTSVVGCKVTANKIHRLASI